MAEIGYIKLWRQMRDNPTVYKDADHIAVWVELLFLAQFHPHDVSFGKDRITLQPGQLITGRKKLAEKLHVSESKVQRILKCFENEHMIEQQTNSQCRLITICSWNKFQQSEQPFEQQMNNEWTTSEQRVNTIQRNKEIKEINNHNIQGKRTQDMTREEKDAFLEKARAKFNKTIYQEI